MFSLLLSALGCSEYNLNEYTPPPEDTADQLPDGGGGVQISACDFIKSSFPAEDFEDADTTDAERLCPFVLQDSSYGDAGTYAVECKDSIETKQTAIFNRATTLFPDDINLVKLLNCEVTLTVFAEYEREVAQWESEGTGFDTGSLPTEDFLNESVKLWLAPGDRRGSLGDFEADGVTEGATLPIDILFAGATHERFDTDYFDSADYRTAGLKNWIAKKNELPLLSETNSLTFSSDFYGAQELNVNELPAYVSGSPYYSLVTATGTLVDTETSLFELVRNACEIDEESEGVFRCEKYFE